jgi:hypothetical protein
MPLDVRRHVLGRIAVVASLPIRGNREAVVQLFDVGGVLVDDWLIDERP